jgi:hypothetical protein
MGRKARCQGRDAPRSGGWNGCTTTRMCTEGIWITRPRDIAVSAAEDLSAHTAVGKLSSRIVAGYHRRSWPPPT